MHILVSRSFIAKKLLERKGEIRIIYAILFYSIPFTSHPSHYLVCGVFILNFDKDPIRCTRRLCQQKSNLFSYRQSKKWNTLMMYVSMMLCIACTITGSVRKPLMRSIPVWARKMTFYPRSKDTVNRSSSFVAFRLSS